MVQKPGRLFFYQHLAPNGAIVLKNIYCEYMAALGGGVDREVTGMGFCARVKNTLLTLSRKKLFIGSVQE